jgi:hypothetical protein
MAGRLTRRAERRGPRSSAYWLAFPRQCLTLPPANKLLDLLAAVAYRGTVPRVLRLPAHRRGRTDRLGGRQHAAAE